VVEQIPHFRILFLTAGLKSSMLSLILLAASLLHPQQTSTECSHTGATIAKAETEPVHGPGGATVVLKVSTADDASKDSHQCNADYEIVFTPAGGAAVRADIITSNGDWGRPISLSLVGFTSDGKHVLGILSEGGGISILFDYQVGGAVAQIVDLKKQFSRVTPTGCVKTLGVIGTTARGAIVLESSFEKTCGANRRWVVDPAGSKAQPLPHGAQVQSPYQSGPR
jgi:hypothetical protein